MVSLLLPVIYLAFISLGLPDSLLGSAWPVMYQELGTSVSAAGIISMIISAGTIVWHRKGHRCQCSDNRCGTVWFFHQPFFLGPVPLGNSLRSRRRKRRCRFE